MATPQNGPRSECWHAATRPLPVMAPLLTLAAQWRSSGHRPLSNPTARRVRLEVAPHQWWNGRTEGRLVIEVVRVEPRASADGAVRWVVVEGWRLLPGGGRRRARDLVRATALPPELLPGRDIAAPTTQEGADGRA